MSVITSIILTVSCVEPGFDTERDDTSVIENVNKFFNKPLNELTEKMINTGRHPQTYTFGGGYNYFSKQNELLNYLNNHDWYAPENVVLIIQPEEGETTVWRPGK